MNALAVAVLSLAILQYSGATPIYRAPFARDPDGAEKRAERLALKIQDAATSWNISPALYAALIFHESEFNPRARSRTGALGLAQLQPGTPMFRYWRRLCRELPRDCDEWWNLWSGAQALHYAKRKCGAIAPALGAYRSGRCIVGPRTQQVLATRRWIERCMETGTVGSCQKSAWLARRIRR